MFELFNTKPIYYLININKYNNLDKKIIIICKNNKI